MQAAVFIEILRQSVQGISVFGEKASLQWGHLVRRGGREQATGTYLLVTATGKCMWLMVVIQDSEKKVRSKNMAHSQRCVGKRLG